jgi:hypothetical protein
MDALLVIVGGPVLLLLLFALVLGWRSPRRGREIIGELRPWKDYGRMAEIEAHDTDEMLDSIDEHRRRRGGRDIAEELSDEAMRGTWEKE